MGTHKNHLGEAILMSTLNIYFFMEKYGKIISKLSSNTHLICLSVLKNFKMTCALYKDTDQHEHPHSLIRVLTGPVAEIFFMWTAKTDQTEQMRRLL